MRFLQQLTLGRMISLRQVDSFNNITIPFSVTLGTVRSLISPLGNFMLTCDTANYHLFDLREKKEIPIKINTTIVKAVFSLDETQIIFTNVIGISAFSYSEQTFTTIVREDKANKITDFQINEDYTILYYLNQTSLISLNLETLTPINSGTSTNECAAVKMKYDFDSQTILTSTLVSNQNRCFICKWNIANNSFVKSQSTNLTLCVINNIYVFDRQIAITKKKFNINLMNTIILNSDSLSQVVRTIESESDNNPAFIVPYHNYYLQYFPPLNQIYVYKDSFTATPFVIQSNTILSVQFNPFTETFYIFNKDPSYSFLNIKTFVPVFNCSKVKDAIFNISSPIDTNCQCSTGMLFNKESFQCQNTTCGDSKNPCTCPKGNTYNSFNLKCQLDCNSISHAVGLKAYGKVSRCLCQSPFMWNSAQSDCSKINCALLNHSSSVHIAQNCTCLPGFVWNNGFQNCIQLNEGDLRLPPTILIDFENETASNITNNSSNLNSESQGAAASPVGLIVGLMIFFLLLLGGAIYYYYRRCKQNGSNPDQEREMEPSPTERNANQKEEKTGQHNAQSDQELKSPGHNSHRTNTTPKKSDKEDIASENLQNFSIDEEEDDREHGFSEIESHLENPLK